MRSDVTFYGTESKRQFREYDQVEFVYTFFSINLKMAKPPIINENTDKKRRTRLPLTIKREIQRLYNQGFKYKEIQKRLNLTIKESSFYRIMEQK